MHPMRAMFGLAVLMVTSHAFGQGEASRLAVKRAFDSGAASLSLKPRDTTVESLLEFARPDGVNGPQYQEKRITPLETTVWRVKATIKEIILRADGDFYMVIEGASGARTVVEVPDPRLCPNSKLIKQIQQVRNRLAAKYHPSGQPQKVSDKVEIVGVGFFGRQGKDTRGNITNGARLMPGIGIKWLG